MKTIKELGLKNYTFSILLLSQLSSKSRASVTKTSLNMKTWLPIVELKRSSAQKFAEGEEGLRVGGRGGGETPAILKLVKERVKVPVTGA